FELLSSADSTWLVTHTCIYGYVSDWLFLFKPVSYTRRVVAGRSEDGVDRFWIDGVWCPDGCDTNCKRRSNGTIHVLSTDASITMVLYRAGVGRFRNLDSSIRCIHQCGTLAKTE